MRPKTGVRHANARLKPRKGGKGAGTTSTKNLKKDAAETETEKGAKEKDTYKYYGVRKEINRYHHEFTL